MDGDLAKWCANNVIMLQIRSQSDVFLGSSSMGGLDALRYVCGWTKALYVFKF
jgi:hypothetical protein